MALTVLHTGQSGVERGADRAARLLGLAIEGFCSFECRDEMGPLPAELARDLKPCATPGTRNALRATLELANALVIAVPDVRRASEVTGIDALRRTAQRAEVPFWIVDPLSNLGVISEELANLTRCSPLRLMVTGPRLTRWADGERIGVRVIGGLQIPGLDRSVSQASRKDPEEPQI